MIGPTTMTFPVYELAAFGAAICWATTALISSVPSGHLGALAFNRLRQAAVTILLAAYVLMSGRLQALSPHEAALLVASGIFGIFLGDTLLFNALNRVGPRRSSILFALNAPISAVLGWLLLNETLPFYATAGITLTCAGVILAIFFGKRPGQTHKLEEVKGSLLVGVMLGLGAALGQATGSIIARPIMASGFDPFLASMLRVGVAACCLSVLMALPFEAVKPRNPPTWKIAGLTVLSGILAMGIGMTLLLFALSGGKTGIVATISATSPVLILPMLWLRTGERPAAGAWAGAAIAVAGMAMLFLNR
jgi:drug/metabolite transporter (DMT)-like permease